MMRTWKIALFALLCWTPFWVLGQTQFSVALPSGQGMMTGGLAQTFDGHFMVGFAEHQGASGVAKVSNSGNILWRLNLGIMPDKIYELADHSLIMAGSSPAFGPTSQLFLLKMQPNGTVIWFKRYQYPNSAFLSDMEVTATGCFVLVGHRIAGGCYILKTDGSGNVLWGRNFNSGGDNVASVAIHPENKYLLAGYGSQSGIYPIGFLSYFDSLGNYSTYETSTAGSPFTDAIFLPDTTLIAIGSGAGFVGQGYLPSMMIVNNVQRGYYRSYLNYGDGWNQGHSRIAAAGDGGWYIVGATTASIGGPRDAYLAKFNRHDSIMWENSFGDLLPAQSSIHTFGAPQMISTGDGGAAFSIFQRDWGNYGYSGSFPSEIGDFSGIMKLSDLSGPCGQPSVAHGILPLFGFNSGGFFYSPTVSALVPTVISGTLSTSLLAGSSVVHVSCFECYEPANASYSSVQNGLQYQFTHLGESGYQYLWDFGDCSTDTIQNPSHTYAFPDNYQVCLTVITGCDTETVCQMVNACNVADFSGSTVACSGSSNTWVGNAGVPNHQWLWDGSPVGSSSSLTLSGLVIGNHTLTHIADNGFCADTLSRAVTVVSGGPIAGFTYTYQNHVLSATSTSSNADVLTWDFGDGSTGNGSNVTHTYAVGDTFTVCLMVSNGCGADTICQTVSCSSVQANLSFQVTGNQVAFTNLSTNATHYFWSFGDGISSPLVNPNHAYGNGATYSGTLSAFNGCSMDVASFNFSIGNAGISSYEREIDWTNQNYAIGVVEAPNNGLFVVTTGSQGSLARLNDEGRVQWVKEISLNGSMVSFTDIARTPDHFLILVGHRPNGFTPRGVVIKCDTSGNVIWANELNTSYTPSNHVEVMANGHYAIAGTVGQGNSAAAYILELDTAGNIIQGNEFNESNGGTELFSFRPTSDGGFLLGTSTGIIKLTSSMAISWNRTITNSFYYRDVVEEPGVAYYAVISEGIMIGGYEAFVAKYDLIGNLQWLRLVDYSVGSFTAYLDLTSIGFDSSGNLIVSGYDWDDPGSAFPPNHGSSDAALLLLNPSNGNTVGGWVFGGNNNDASVKMTTSQNGDIVLVGYTNSSGTMGIWRKNFTALFGQQCNSLNGWTNTIAISSNYPLVISSSTPIFSFNSLSVNQTSRTATYGDSCLSVCNPAIVGLLHARNGMTVSFQSTGGTANFDFGDGTTASNTASVSHTYSSLPAVACATRSNNCGISSECASIGSPSCGIASFTGILFNQCRGISSTATATSTGSVLSQEWMLDGIVVGNGATYSLANDLSGLHLLQLSVQFNGCTDTASAWVRVTETYPFDLGPDFALCPGDTVVLGGFGSNLNVSWNGGSGTPFYAVTAPGTIIATSNQNGGPLTCTYRDTLVVTAGTPAPPISLGPDLLLCGNFCETLEATAGFMSYAWSHSISNTQFSQVSDTGTFIVEGFHSGGCSARDTIRVTGGNNFSPTIIGQPNICAGAPITLGTSIPFSSYLWSDGSTGPTLQVNTPGLYWVETSIGSCIGRDTVVIGTATPTVPNIGPDQSFCSGSSVSLTAGAGFSNYLWSNGAGSPSVSANAGGIWWVETTDTNGCPARDSVNLTVLGTPMINLGNDTLICSGNPLTLDAGSGYASYSWNMGPTTSTLTVPFSGTYSVTVTNNLGCTDADTITVTISTTPVVSLGLDRTICNGGSVLLNASSVFASYLWNTGATTYSISVSTPGSYSVTVSNLAGCTASDTILVTLVPDPVVNLGPDTTLCIGGAAVLDAGAGFASYLWSNGATTPSISVSNAGTYSVTVTNSAGCTGSDARVVSVVQNPVVNLGPIQTICSGISTVLNAGGGFSSYSWNTGATTPSITVSSTGNYSVTVTNSAGCTGIDSVLVSVVPNPMVNLGPDITLCGGDSTVLSAGAGYAGYLWSTGATTSSISASAPGTYSVTVTSNAGCTGSDAVLVSVSPNPSVNLGPDTTICSGNSVTLDAGGGFASYLWSTGATTSAISASTSGSYSVTVTNGAGCFSSDTIELLPGLSAPASQFSFMQTGSVVDFMDNSTGVVDTWLWDFGDGGTLSTQNPTHQYISAGNFTVCLTVENSCAADTSCQPLVVTAVDPFLGGNSFVVYPNPSDGRFFAQMQFNSPGATRLMVVNGLGQIVYDVNLGVGSNFAIEIPGDRWAVGAYQVVVFHGGDEMRKTVIRD